MTSFYDWSTERSGLFAKHGSLSQRDYGVCILVWIVFLCGLERGKPALAEIDGVAEKSLRGSRERPVTVLGSTCLPVKPKPAQSPFSTLKPTCYCEDAPLPYIAATTLISYPIKIFSKPEFLYLRAKIKHHPRRPLQWRLFSHFLACG